MASFEKLVSMLFSQRRRRGNRSPLGRQPRRRPGALKLEQLEARELLSGNPVIMMTLQEDNGAIVVVTAAGVTTFSDPTQFNSSSIQAIAAADTGSSADGPITFSGGIGPSGAGGSDFTVDLGGGYYGLSNSPGGVSAVTQEATVHVTNNTGDAHTLHINVSPKASRLPPAPRL